MRFGTSEVFLPTLSISVSFRHSAQMQLFLCVRHYHDIQMTCIGITQVLLMK